jgi:protein-S-isoprenylcysteine O-methyltransferase Ste14
MLPLLRTVTITLFVIVFASFAWAMTRFFAKTERQPSMRLIELLGLTFALIHIGAIAFRSPPKTPWIVSAWLLYVIALILFWSAVSVTRNRQLSFAFSLDRPEYFVTEGPYKIVRHPFYVSYICAWMAGASATALYPLLVTVIVMIYLYWKAAELEEEKFSTSQFAKDYARYKITTGQFMPLPSWLVHRSKTVWSP